MVQPSDGGGEVRAPPILRVALADPAHSPRAALADVLRELPGVRLVAERPGVDALAPALRNGDVDVLLLDDRLLGALPPAAPRVIALGMNDDRRFAERARSAGALAWVAKERAAERVPALLAELRPGDTPEDEG